MRRITGTHVYSYVKCPRLAALDLHQPRSERRPPTEWEEFAAWRGRDFEERHVATLPVVQPAYPERDFAAGAVATMALLRDGVDWIHQAVLQVDDRLGLPDLLRRVDGESSLGAHHYEVIDVKTSGRARSDQLLQVVFYSQLLAELQDRMPTHGAIVLKDGTEERFELADYLAAAAEVLRELQRLRADERAARPFLQPGCTSCHWNHRCLPELEAAGDLSLVQGMSHGARAILEASGCTTLADLAVFHPEGARARGNLDATLLRRLRRGAQARLAGAPVFDARPRGERLDDAAIVHLLTDAYADRVLAIGVLPPGKDAAAAMLALPRTRDEEWTAFVELVEGLPRRASILHFGEALRRFHEDRVFAHDADPVLEGRFVDLQPRLRAAAVFPGPVFGLADLVRHGLGRDPFRAGHAQAAAWWTTLPDGDERLCGKLRADLADLAALRAELLDVERAAPGAAAGTATA